MNAFVFAVTVTVGVLTFPVSVRAQSLEVLQYPSDNVTILKFDWYQNPPPSSWYCHSCFDNRSRYGGSGLSLRFDSNQPRCCRPEVNLTKDDASPEFVYRVRIRNHGLKMIRAIEWDYIFVDRVTQTEAARHHFQSEENIRPDKRKTLLEYSMAPPTKVISARVLLQAEANSFIEKVIIKRVTYEDGSIWIPH